MSISRRLKFAAPCLMALLSGAGNQGSGPHYTADGSLILPADYREWVFLSSGLDMSYTEAPATSGGAVFDNVFVAPAAWTAFKTSGHWPDKTVFAMENRGALLRLSSSSWRARYHLYAVLPNGKDPGAQGAHLPRAVSQKPTNSDVARSARAVIA